MMPVEAGEAGPEGAHATRGAARHSPATSAPDPETEDLVMLVRQRKSRIYFLRRFFDYPISLTAATFRNLGVGAHFALRRQLSALGPAAPARRETLEDFIINRFGKQLYLTFFKSYTEKVWGVPCNEISAEWGAQRIKGLSLKGVVAHFLKKTFGAKPSGDIAQKQTETSLIEKFLYPQVRPRPALGACGRPGERAAGGEIHFGIQIDRVIDGNSRVSVEGSERSRRARHALPATTSSPPCRFATWCAPSPRWNRAGPAEVTEVSEGLMYRDFITVGLLASRWLSRKKTARRSRTTGSTSRSRMWWLAGCRSSTTGAPGWSPTRTKSGSASNTSATTPTICGSSPTKRCPASPSPRSPRSEFSEGRRC
jgi:hypothetical protein